MQLLELLRQPLPWYVGGPLIGLTVPLLLLLGNKSFGVSANLQHLCAMIPSRIPYFNYDWRKTGGWSLLFALGIVLGGLVAGVLLDNPEPIRLSERTVADLAALGVGAQGEYVPQEIFSWQGLFTLPGFLLMVVGGFLVGFGARYAGGCTSGHAITGLANLQLPSLVAVIGFFIGGLLSAHLLLPLILGGGNG
ncbi:MAG: YeeE/YedE thiosulfate transporter family protein [Trueperaceae bacterium]